MANPLQLAPEHRPALLQHFLGLPPEDLRLRFGATVGPATLEAYVADMDFGRDAVFGVFGEDLLLAGVAHVARLTRAAEFGVSVLPGHRGRGVGKALFARAVTYARNTGVATFFMHCLAENQAMMHVARSSGMEVVLEQGEADAYLQLAPADPASRADALLQDRIALLDFAFKSQWLAARTVAEAMTEAVERLQGKG